MSRKTAELLLAAVIIARSTAYLFSKIVMEDLDPLNLMAVRFILAFVFLFVLFFKRVINIDKTSLLNGVILGSIFFAVMCRRAVRTEIHRLVYNLFSRKHSDSIRAAV